MPGIRRATSRPRACLGSVTGAAEFQAPHLEPARHRCSESRCKRPAQLPQRFAFDLRVQVPNRIDKRRGGQVHDALFRSKPAELAVGDKASPKGCHVGCDVLEVAPDDVVREQVYCGHAQLGSAADGEREAVPGQAVGMVGLEDDVGGRIVGIFVHRIRPVEGSRGRKADVARDGSQDPCAHLGSELYAKAPMFVNPGKVRELGQSPLSAITSDLLAGSHGCRTIHTE